MNQFFFAGQLKLVQDARLLVGDGFAGRVKPDVLPKHIQQNAALGVRQRAEQKGANQMRLRGDALRGGNQCRNEREKAALIEISGSKSACAGVNDGFVIFIGGENDDAGVRVQANRACGFDAVQLFSGEVQIHQDDIGVFGDGDGNRRFTVFAAGT